jgi:hypothetical protein
MAYRTIPQEKSPKRLIRMSLPVDLVQGLEEMAESHDKMWGVTLHTMIRKSLKWAVWARSHGRAPDVEMMTAVSQEKSSKRLIRMKLPVELMEALEKMAGSSEETDTIIGESLEWAVSAHHEGHGPDVEMSALDPTGLCRGYGKWNEKIRERRDVAELERLFLL